MTDLPPDPHLVKGLTPLAERMRSDSDAWFPLLHERGEDQIRLHYAIGLAGEVGEALNHVKKLNRDGVVDEAALADELADVFVYLQLLAHSFDIDLLDAWVAKRLQLVARWGDPAELAAEAQADG